MSTARHAFAGIGALLLLGSGWLMIDEAARAAASSQTSPVLVELFTSEGCSSCPPADDLLAALDREQPVAGARAIVLSEHVDYWDRLGWRDPLSNAGATARQQSYARRFRLDSVYTPQIVVDGSDQFVGSNRRRALSAISGAAHKPKLVLSLSAPVRRGSRIEASVTAPALQEPAELYVGVAEDQTVSEVRRGENQGRTLRHVAAVRTLERLGRLNAGETLNRLLDLPAAAMRPLRLVAFLQQPEHGRVLAVAAQAVK